MKTKFLTTIAVLCLTPALHAASFTVDFTAYAGQTIPSELVIHVDGYGDVKFSAGVSFVTNDTSTFEVDDSGSLLFDNGDSLTVTFMGSQTSEQAFDIGDARKMLIYGSPYAGLTSNQMRFTSIIDDNSISGFSFNAEPISEPIPEPGSALLGLLGTAGLVVRRRR